MSQNGRGDAGSQNHNLEDLGMSTNGRDEHNGDHSDEDLGSEPLETGDVESETEMKTGTHSGGLAP